MQKKAENCKESISSKAWHLPVKCSLNSEKATLLCVESYKFVTEDDDYERLVPLYTR